MSSRADRVERLRAATSAAGLDAYVATSVVRAGEALILSAAPLDLLELPG